MKRGLLAFLAVVALLLLLRPFERRVAGATVVAASCSNADITTAIGLATDGDTVTVPAGSCTWTADVTIPNTKGIILQGSGITRPTCVAVNCTASDDAAIGALSGTTAITLATHRISVTVAEGNAVVTITGFQFTKTTGQAIDITGTATSTARWRIHDNIFDCDTVTRDATMIYTHKVNFGVLDHNVFRQNFTGQTPSCVRIQTEWDNASDSSNDQGGWWWTQTVQRGSAKEIYYEDNWVLASGSQIYEARWGSQIVARYNYIRNPAMETHSACTNFGRNAPWVEVYKNAMPNNANQRFPALFFRSSSGIAWANTIGTSANGIIEVDFERSWRGDCLSGAAVKNAWCGDLSNSYDDNTGGQHGYKCFGQPGWGPPQATDMSATAFAGVFSWGNTRNGSASDFVIANTSATPVAPATTNYESTHVQYGREVFRGSTEITQGVIATRSATCSAGPASRSIFVSTDENSQGARVYYCSATNTWTQLWEPYTYPHPLDTPPPSVVITTTTLAAAVTGRFYGETVVATGGTDPDTFTKSAGSLPTGLSLASTGAITGVPIATGTFNFTVLVTDGAAATDTQDLSIVVTAGTASNRWRVRGIR